ncbi:MAG: hypothetical protein ACPG31_02360 [Planctomycetota bacterium]
MAKPRKSFLLRVDPKLHDALRRWADDDFRSLNAQTEMILRRALLDAGRLKEGEEQVLDAELPGAAAPDSEPPGHEPPDASPDPESTP